MSEQEQRAEKDAPLRRDIRTLGDALGRAIRQHSRPEVFETEEWLRLHCRRLRECAELLQTASSDEATRLREEIDALDAEITHVVEKCDLLTAIDVIRAFTVYFHLVNTAEQQHRIRRRKGHENPRRRRLLGLGLVLPDGRAAEGHPALLCGISAARSKNRALQVESDRPLYDLHHRKASLHGFGI